MDISKSILYRGLELNGASLGTARTLRGIAIESADYSVVEAVGYTEKRAGSDGMHASDIFLGGRSVQLSGHIYGTDLADMFDWLHVLRSVFSPTSAYQQSPADRGFLPLRFFQSTHDHTSFPAIVGPPASEAGLMPLYMLVRPQRPPTFTIVRDRQDRSGPNTLHGIRPTGIPWGVSLLAKDPRVYIDPDQSVPVNGAANTPNGTIYDATNRGDYETPLNIMLYIAAAPAAAGTFRVAGLNGMDMTITIEKVANVVYRWFGDDRVLMTEAVNPDGTSKGSPLVLRMDLVTFATKQRKPMVPAAINPPEKPFKSRLTYYRSVTLAAGSRMFWSEAFA